tara:strand:- start:445 stop:768 length:324 start_codon:yes stop_codon:yes gene_type:complete
MSKYMPGELHDKNGYPIYPGDLIRQPHFRGARRKQHYLYHTAVMVNPDIGMEIVPTCHLQPEKAKGGGRCRITAGCVEHYEIIHGYGPDPILSFEDRPRLKRETPND